MTTAALHCQVETTQGMLDRDADYLLLSVKDHHSSLHTFLQQKFGHCNGPEAKLPGPVTHTPCERSYRRKALRHYYTRPATLAHRKVLTRWPGLKSITTVYLHRTLTENIRSHRSIENSQHHVLHVTFAKDASRTRQDSAPEISSAIRHMALNILQQDTTVRDHIRGENPRTGRVEKVLERI